MEKSARFVKFPLEAGRPHAEFRFTTASAQALEDRAGCAPWILSARGQSVKALVLMLTYALQHSDAAITEKKAARLIDQFITRGGKVRDLADALTKALNVSGVYGEPEAVEEADGEAAEVDPPMAETEPSTA